MKTRGRLLLCALWLFAACAGAWGLLNYENTPTGAAETPLQWPSESRITRPQDRPTLLMFAHPHCPCTQASIGELNRLLTRCRSPLAMHVLFIQPKGVAPDWTDTALRRSTEAIPGVGVQLDPDGAEAHRFGAESSGYLVLYSAEGKLLFSGGITAARGHAGDNAGENAVVALLNGQNAELKHTDVFGCSLYRSMLGVLQMKTAMENNTSDAAAKPVAKSARTLELFNEMQQAVTRHTDTLFGRLMIWQWVASVGAAVLITPQTWIGTQSHIHVHVFAAIFLGGLITALPVFMALRHPGLILTRHTVAVGQMLMSALLIHLTGGRIETHFHVFGSLAILAFYRDWRVLISASAVVYADHLLRGFFWPQSVYGTMTATIWRSLEHAGWVIFEVTFLIISIRKSLGETLKVAERQAKLEDINETIEQTVTERTLELTREITERQQAAASLNHSQAQLAKAQSIARLGSWEWDVVQNKVTWSIETQRLYGYSDQDLGADMNRCLERIHPEDRDKVQLALAEALRSGGPYICDHRALLADGTIRVMHGLGEVVKDAKGQPVRIIGTTQDITEAERAEAALRRSEEQLRQSQKMEAVGRLAGGVAHDFNNLLTVITCYSSMSLRQMEKTHPLRKNTEEVQAAAERAASLTGQLLAFSRKQVLQPRVINLNETVSGMEKMLRRLIGEDIELCTLFDPEIGHVKADPGQFEQVILNLGVNARDAMPRGGKLTIQTANVSLDQKTRFRNRDLDVGEYVMVAVSDTGVGMTEEVKSHLFEPFFTTKGVGRGTGLGLATCYGIVCQSDGDIRVYSELDCGTTFKIYLPRVDAPTTPTGDSPDSDTLPDGTESILIVEDEAAVRRLAASVLRSSGYQVQEARDAIEGFELIQSKQPFDLVITDVIMPKMSGKELYDKIKVFAPRIKVLFMSGYTDDALAHHGVLGPELSFLEKPFSPSRLAHKVREVIDGAKGRSRFDLKPASNGNGLLNGVKH